MRTSVVISLVIFFNIISAVYGQGIFPEELPDVLPERFRIELNMDSVSYYSEHKKEAKENRGNSISYINQFTEKDLFESGTIGYNYDIIEQYLNNIIQKITSTEFIKKYNIHVYPSLETEMNAYALPHDGTILFNVHNFIYLKNEAEVAYILAHEIGHLIQKHNATEEWLNYMNSFDFFAGKKRKYEKASQNAEIDADHKAALMLAASGYNNEAALSVELLFTKLETNLKNYKAYKKNIYLKTHPPSMERLDSAKVWITESVGKDYLVDKLLFSKIKEGARMHSIKNAFKSHDYFSCLELAFEGYLSEVNPEYIYYVSESTRRLMYNKTLKYNRNIFSAYYNNMFALEFPNRIDKNIFLSEGQDSIMTVLRKQRIYNTQKFFNYFVQLSMDNNGTEALLTKGLYDYSSSKGKKKEFLNQYVSKNGQFKEFAENLITPKKLSDKKSLYVFNSIYAYTCQGKKPIKLYFLEKDLRFKFDSLSSYMYDERCPVIFKEHKTVYSQLQSNLKESIFLNNLSNLVSPLLTKKENLTILSPELGTYLIKNEYSTFQYIDFTYQLCANSGVTALAMVVARTYVQPTAFLSKSILYNRNKKKCIGLNKTTAGKLTLNAYKYKLKKDLAKTNFR